MEVSIYPTPQSLQAKVDEYFEHCFAEVYLEKYDRWVRKAIEPPTFSGMARYLGFPSRGAFLAYKNKGNPLYEQVINDAKLRIEEYYEGQLVTTKGNAAGLMFALKNNADWDDEVKHTFGNGEGSGLAISWNDNAKDVIDAHTVEDPKQLAETKPVEAPPPVEQEDKGWEVVI